MAENNTNVFLDILQSFDAGEFPTFHPLQFDVVTLAVLLCLRNFEL